MKRPLVALTILAASVGFVTDITAESERSISMKTFVLVFRQRPPQLSPADLERRATEVRAWAQEQNAAGRKLDPRIPGDEGFYVGVDGKTVPVTARSEERVSALLFIEARDLDDALAVARSHPGLRYGVVSVEVRPWSSPVTASTAR